MNTMFPKCLRKNRRGAAAVEFAIVAPIFFLLVFGMIEYGRMIMVQQVITNAAREGARTAVLDGATITGSSGVDAVVDNYLTSAKISTSATTIGVTVNNVSTTDLSTTSPGDAIGVTVSIPFKNVSWLPSPLYLGSTTLSATAVMSREGVQY
jgi:Flp pilus assembly protein TadG